MRTLMISALASALIAAGCITVNTTTNQYNGDKAVKAALTNAPSAYSRAFSTLTTTNGVAATEITAGGGIVTTVNVNSAKTTDPVTTIPVSMTK